MTVLFTLPGVAQSFISEKSEVITNVVRGVSDNSISSDQNREQISDDKGITHPTQVANGVYNITGTRAPSENAKNTAPDYKYGSEALDVGVTQELPDTKNLDKTHPDSGYMIHITPYLNTNGCVGIHYDINDPDSKKKAEEKMDFIVNLYKETMGSEGDKNATVEYRD